MLRLRSYKSAVTGRRTPQNVGLIWFLTLISLLCVTVMFLLLVPCYTNSNLLQQDSNYMTPILAQTQMENIEHEMRRRQLTVMDQCHNTSSSKVKNIDQTPRILKVVKKLFIEKEHKLVWCPIYKAGSTTWMEIFATIGGVMTPKNRMRLSKGLIQINQLARMVYPKTADTKATLKLLPETTRFIIVRHPFERILSAYRDKLEHRKDREFYYRHYGRHIVRLQRDKNATFVDRAEPTFVEFLQYLVKTKTFDEHWRPFTVECAPCELNYQFILKMESLEKEQLFLATKFNLLNFLLTVNSMGQLLQNTNPNGRTERKCAQKYYGQVPKQLLQEVYVLYEEDFRLFDYSPKEYFSFAKECTDPGHNDFDKLSFLMHNGKSITELPVPKRARTCIQDHHNIQYSPEHEVLISHANEMFGLHAWSHTVTYQNIDYIDCEGSEYSAGVMAFVKVELKNGIHHQDVGYGICSGSCSKGYAIAHARKEAATNGFREALRSFGCDLTRKVNGSCRPADVPVQSNAFQMSPQMDKHSLVEEVPISSRHLTDTSPTACLQTANDNLKLERKRRQRQKQEEFLQQLKEKQSTNCKDLQTKLLVDKNTGIKHNEEKENDLMDGEALISTQELNRVVQSAEVQQSRTPLLCSPPKRTVQTSSPWPATRDTIMPRQLLMHPRRIPVCHNTELPHSKKKSA